MRGTTIGLFLVILVCVIVGVVYWTRLAEQPVPETVQPVETALVGSSARYRSVLAAAPAPVPGPEPEQDPAAVAEEPASMVPEAAPRRSVWGTADHRGDPTGCKQIQQLPCATRR